MALLDDVKQVCRVTSDAYDAELTLLIEAGLADMGVTDINPELLIETADLTPLIKRALFTYCKMNFGKLEDSTYDRFKTSYDEQKAQLLMSSAYNAWEV